MIEKNKNNKPKKNGVTTNISMYFIFWPNT